MPKAPDFWWRSETRPQALALWPVSRLLGAVAGWRMKRPPRFDPPVPVLCVGNFVVGGAGKTPTAMALARIARGRRLTPGILSRGYGGSLKGPVVVDPALHNAGQVGDEAILHAQAAPTVVASDRAAGARRLIAEGADFIIMDDGFQNPSITKDLSLIVVDAGSGAGNGYVMPAGPLRAPLDLQLRRADCLLVVGTGNAAEPLIRKAARAGRPAMAAQLQPIQIRQWRNEPVLAFAGIGRPEKFFETLRGIRADVVETRSFPDHHMFTSNEADEMLAVAKAKNLRLVTTEKDRMRLAGMGGSLGELFEASDALKVTMRFDNQKAIAALIDETVARSVARLA
jgi:tetraacyldisaccharide 4'-kinase